MQSFERYTAPDGQVWDEEEKEREDIDEEKRVINQSKSALII